MSKLMELLCPYSPEDIEQAEYILGAFDISTYEFVEWKTDNVPSYEDDTDITWLAWDYVREKALEILAGIKTPLNELEELFHIEGGTLQGYYLACTDEVQQHVFNAWFTLIENSGGKFTEESDFINKFKFALNKEDFFD